MKTYILIFVVCLLVLIVAKGQNAESYSNKLQMVLEKEVEVPANITQLNMRIDNNGGGTVWFDDVRIYPSESQVTTYTYDPLVGMTSVSDANGQSTVYEYDGFNRLRNVYDNDRKVVNHHEYHYGE